MKSCKPNTDITYYCSIHTAFPQHTLVPPLSLAIRLYRMMHQIGLLLFQVLDGGSTYWAVKCQWLY